MKLKTILLALCIVAGSMFAKANKASLFTYDKAKVQNEMKAADAIVNEHLQSGKSLTEMKAENNAVVSNVNLSSKSFSSSNSSDGPFGIPSFLWGCVFGLIGIVVVYVITEDSDEAKKALFGCLAGVLVVIVLNLTVFAGVFFSI